MASDQRVGSDEHCTAEQKLSDVKIVWKKMVLTGPKTRAYSRKILYPKAEACPGVLSSRRGEYLENVTDKRHWVD